MYDAPGVGLASIEEPATEAPSGEDPLEYHEYSSSDDARNDGEEGE